MGVTKIEAFAGYTVLVAGTAHGLQTYTFSVVKGING